MRNIAYADVEKCLALLTFLSMDEVRRLGSYKDEKINESKETLAFEVTKMIHGEEEAVKAQEASRALFKGSPDSSDVPTVTITAEELGDGLDILTILDKAGLISSKSEGRRLVQQNGIAVDGTKVTDIAQVFTPDDFSDGLLIKKGKKIYKKVTVA